MNETAYAEVFDLVLSVDDAGRRAVLDALFVDLPPEVRDRLAVPLWSWSCDAPPAFDVALGDSDNVIRAALEFKSPDAKVNWTSLKAARDLPLGIDPLVDRIYDEAVAPVDPRFDAPHPYDATACSNHRHTGKGAAGIHQGDLYRACLPGVTNMRRPDHLSEVVYIFVAPSPQSAARWREGLISWDEWHILRLWEVLPRWQAIADTHGHVAVLADATKRFVGR